MSRVDSEAVERLRELAHDALGEGNWPHPYDVGGMTWEANEEYFIAAASPAFVLAILADWERRGQALARLTDAVEELKLWEPGRAGYVGVLAQAFAAMEAARSVLTGEETT